MSGVAEASLCGSGIEEESSSSVVEIRPSIHAGILLSLYDEQIRLLVQRLFFHPEQPRYRHVGFTAIDLHSDIVPLCLNMAQALSEQGKHEVGLIDACPHSSTSDFENKKIQVCEQSASEVANMLRIVQRREWIEDTGQVIYDENLARLCELSRQFDFSILCCGPMSWLTTRVSRICDGLVLVLTANQTRRLAAQKIRQQLEAAQIPVLGTVLAQRRFPVPGSLYRKL